MTEIREFTAVERKIYDKIASKHVLTPVTCQMVSLVNRGIQLLVTNCLVYKIEKTDSFLILGSETKQINMDVLRQRYLDSLVKKNEEDPDFFKNLDKSQDVMNSNDDLTNMVGQMVENLGENPDISELLNKIQNPEELMHQKLILEEENNNDELSSKKDKSDKIKNKEPQEEEELLIDVDLTRVDPENLDYLVNEFQISKAQAYGYLVQNDYDFIQAVDAILEEKKEKNQE